MKEQQRRLPAETTQQVDAPEPIFPVIRPEIFNIPQGDSPSDEDFAIYLNI